MKQPIDRVAYSPGEFAALFGKSQTWGYRQIYAGKVKAITEHGRLLVPAKEVERILGSAAEYLGKPRGRVKPSQFELELADRNRAWKEFVAGKRGSQAAKPGLMSKASQPLPQAASQRSAALARLTRGKKP